MDYRRVGGALLTALALTGLFVALALPHRLDWISARAFIFFPLELVLIGLLLLVPGRLGSGLRVLLACLLSLAVITRLADLVTHEAYARRFNLIFDLHLLADASRLLEGALGRFATVAVGLILLTAVALVGWLAFALLGRIQRWLHAAPGAASATLLALLMVWGVLKVTGWTRADAYAWHQLVVHTRDTLHSIRDIRAFADTVGQDPLVEQPPEGLFSVLAGKDVYLVFVESYGRALLELEPFAKPVTATLAEAETVLAREGWQMRSGFLTAPIVGGMSWLGRTAVVSGAWTDSQTRYQSLILSERTTLNHLFREAGWRTVAAMPAITLAWPEGGYYGYDHIYDAHNFGYEGLPFNWVTMPDQYVWSALHERERAPQERAPLMAELALISSHAPWTPVAELVPWDQVEDGRIFNEQAQSGLTPEQVWSNLDSIRYHYRRTIQYSLDVLVSYIETFGDDDLVLLVMGDHPAAPMVTGDPDDRDVPVHLIARDPAVIEAVAHWQWQPGLLPDDSAPVWRMDEVRDRFVETFSHPENKEQP